MILEVYFLLLHCLTDFSVVVYFMCKRQRKKKEVTVLLSKNVTCVGSGR